MSNISKYKRMYDIVAAKRCSDEELERLKDMYADVINSKRRLECIGSLTDLLQVLEKRDYLHVNNIEPLREIASMFEEFSHINFSEGGIVNISQNQNINSVSHTVNTQHEQITLPNLPSDPKERAYYCIASDIGQKWADLARALGVPEGYIDNLNYHRHTSRVYEILRYYEDRCDPRKFRSGLLEGLKQARRNDLRLKVQHIFDVYAH